MYSVPQGFFSGFFLLPILFLQVLVKLEGGIGLSLVNKVPEELIFASLTRINVHYTHMSASQVLELSVQDVQVFVVMKQIYLFVGLLECWKVELLIRFQLLNSRSFP